MKTAFSNVSITLYINNITGNRECLRILPTEKYASYTEATDFYIRFYTEIASVVRDGKANGQLLAATTARFIDEYVQLLY